MPLTTTDQPGVPDDGRRAISFWMIIEGASPVRVFVTYEALWKIDPSHPRDVSGAIGIFNENRKRIEAAASHKWDANGIDDGQYEGRPILIVRSEDLPENSKCEAQTSKACPTR